MSYVETKDLRLIYFDSLRYLVPHAVRTYTNSLAWQRRMLGWVPVRADHRRPEGPLGLRQRGGRRPRRATCSSSTSRPLRTPSRPSRPASGCTSLMNHEMVHVATGDVAHGGGPALAPAASSARWLARSGSTPSRSSTATSPSRASLAALVQRGRRGLHRDVDGGRPGPRPGRLRRDGVPRDGARRRPLLRPAGPRLARHARRLPGRRQRLPLRHALHHLARLRPLAGEGRRVDPARRGQRALLLGPASSRSSASPSSRPGRTGSPSSTSSSGRTSPRSASTRSRRFEPLVRPRRGLGLARCTSTRRAARSTPPSATRASSITSARSTLATAPCGGSRTSSGRCSSRVTSLAYDPAGGTLFYTNDNMACRDLMAARREDGRGAHAARGRAHRRARLQPRGPVAAGACGSPTASRRWCASRRRTTRGTRSAHASLRARPLRPRHLARRAAALRVDGRGQRRPVPARVGHRPAPRGRHEAAVRVPLRAVRSRRASSSRPTGATCTAAATTRASPTSSATRSPRKTCEAVSNAETGFFRPRAAGRRAPAGARATPAEGFVPADRSSPRREGRERDPLPRARKSRRSTPSSRPGRCRPRARSTTTRSSPARAPTSRCATLALDNAFPVLQGYKDSVGIGYHVQLRGPARLRERRPHRGRTRPTATCPARSAAHVELTGQLPRLEGQPLLEPLGLLRPVRPDARRAARATRPSWATPHWLVYDPPRTLELTSEIAYYDKIDAAAELPERGGPFDRLVTAELGCTLQPSRCARWAPWTTTRASAGRPC